MKHFRRISPNNWPFTGCVSIFVLAISTPLFWFGSLLAWSPISNAITIQRYSQGQCTILAKALSSSSYYNQETGNDESEYAPHFTFLVQTATHVSYHAEGYAIDQHTSDQQADAQAILEHYRIGGTYSCWYDPANGSHAVLTRDVSAWLLLPGGIMRLISLGLLVGAVIFMRRL